MARASKVDTWNFILGLVLGFLKGGCLDVISVEFELMGW